MAHISVALTGATFAGNPAANISADQGLHSDRDNPLVISYDDKSGELIRGAYGDVGVLYTFVPATATVRLLPTSDKAKALNNIWKTNGDVGQGIFHLQGQGVDPIRSRDTVLLTGCDPTDKTVTIFTFEFSVAVNTEISGG